MLYKKTEDYTLYQGKMEEELKNFDSNSIDSIVTDPPYELNFMNKGWDNSGIAFQKSTWEECFRVLKPGGHLLAFGGSRTFHRIAVAIEDAGFEIRDTIMWLYGSGFPKSLNLSKSIEAKLTTGSANTQEFRKLSGSKVDRGNYGYASMQYNQDARPADYNKIDDDRLDKLEATTEEAKKWDGWGTALKPAYEPIIVARKPCEGSTTDNVLEYGVGGINIDECRVGEDYIEGGTAPNLKEAGLKSKELGGENKIGFNLSSNAERIPYEGHCGRFPANVIIDGSDEVKEGMPYSKGASSQNNFSDGHIYRGQSFNESSTSLNGYREWYNDEGSASRYFKSCEYSDKDVDLTPSFEPIIVARKPCEGSVTDNVLEYGVGGINIDECRVPLEDGYVLKTTDRQPKSGAVFNTDTSGYDNSENHMASADPKGRFPANIITDGSEEVAEGMPYTKSTGGSGESSIKSGLSGNVYQGGWNHTVAGDNIGGLGDEGSAMRYFYCAKASKKDRDEGLNGFEVQRKAGYGYDRGYMDAGEGMFKDRQTLKRNIHPTVKPTELMQYLVRLVSPKGATVLDPFMGSGSTGKAVMIENRERNANYKFVGVELTEDYLPICEARIEFGKGYIVDTPVIKSDDSGETAVKVRKVDLF